jgi:energy-coupling factor transporter ATP-binding protein EcfA2
MRLLSVEVKNFKRFTGTARITGLQPGLNVMFGRNEFGKSTLMRAINAAIFEKSNSGRKEVRELRHVKNKTVPEVTLAFEIGGMGWTVQKRFAGATGKTLLENAKGLRFEGEEAEAEISRLFGFDVGAKGDETSIWGTLWVEQGKSIQGPSVSGRARSTIEGCIEGQVGAVVGGERGQNIRDAVQTAMDLILTGKTGQPKGSYKQALTEVENLTAEIGEMTRRREEVSADLKRLAETKTDLANLVRDRASQDYDGKLAAAEFARTEAVQKAAEVRELATRLELARAKAKNAAADLAQRTDLVGEIDEVRADLTPLARRADEAATAVREAHNQVTQAENDLAAAKQALATARENVVKLERARSALVIKADLDRLENSLTSARLINKKLGAKRGMIAAIKVTDESLERIDEAGLALQKSIAAKDAVATGVSYDLTEKGRSSLKIDGRDPSGLQFTNQASNPTKIEMAGYGSIQIEPKIKDLAKIAKAISDAEAEMAEALVEVGVKSAADARVALVGRRKLEKEAGELAAELKVTLLSLNIAKIKSAEDLSAEVDGLKGRLASETAQLPADAPTDLAALEAALETVRKAVDDAQGTVDTLDAALTAYRAVESKAIKSQSGIASQIESLNAVIRSKETVLEGFRKAEANADVEKRVTSSNAEVEAQDKALSARRAAGGADVEAHNATISRLRGARDNTAKQISTLESRVAALDAGISSTSGQGLDEKIADKTADRERLDARVSMFKEDAEVLSLLLETLETAESEAKSKYLAPVVDRIQPYLGMLLPDARIVIDENLEITGLLRGELDEKMEMLSMGTQEQLAVLTRLAFADLLRDQDRPATVILDDALVYSDDDRIGRMFDVLTRAAKNTQILVFTCRASLFSRLGANMVEFEESAS